jgi:hypothetical protein
VDTKRRHGRVGARLAALTSASLIALGILPGPVGAVVPTDGGAFSATAYRVNVSISVDAYDPHVSGDFVSYTAGPKIRYYDFFTGTDTQVPSPSGATDFLSDLSGSRIVFARNAAGTSRIMVFDMPSGMTTEIDPQAGPMRAGAAIGADTVAFIDLSNGTGDLHASFLGGSTSKVTSDGRYTQNPQVAPLGSVIVFESCATDPSDCSVRQAAWNGSSWQVTDLTVDGAGAVANPDTDGVIAVYDVVRAGDREIAWQPVGGGSEQVLHLSGEQRNPSVSTGIVAFEATQAGGAADLFLYEIATNRTFRVTSTPADESLNDVFVLGNGTVRVAWAEGPFGDRDVRGADIELPRLGQSYTFGGLLAPVDPLPTLNSMKAGAAVPVKFSLGGDFGLDIFKVGYPGSQTAACSSTDPVDGVEQTVIAGGSGLTYDPASDLYTYVWKTEKTWAGTCRQLVLWFHDGTVARANFKFK